jgi:hypothetical protein
MREHYPAIRWKPTKGGPSAVGLRRAKLLHLSARTYNALSNDGIETVADLVQYNHQDLLSLRNFGRRSLYEVEAALAGHSAALVKAPGKKQPAYAALIKATLASRRERRAAELERRTGERWNNVAVMRVRKRLGLASVAHATEPRSGSALSGFNPSHVRHFQ